MLRKAMALGLLAILAGCGSTYYRVTNPGTGQVYYTTGYQDLGYGQGIRFNDLKSGAVVTLPASQVNSIKKEDLPPDVPAK